MNNEEVIEAKNKRSWATIVGSVLILLLTILPIVPVTMLMVDVWCYTVLDNVCIRDLTAKRLSVVGAFTVFSGLLIVAIGDSLKLDKS